MSKPKPYEYKSESVIADLKLEIDILLITVTEVESSSLHAVLNPLPHNTKIIAIGKGILTYYLGSLGKFKVCHVESRMGSLAPGGSLMTILQAIGDWAPKAIIMMGIAFGKDKIKQKIGDVFLSETIIQYETKKITKEGKTEYRGDRQPCGVTLLNRFRTHSKGWQFETANNKYSSLLPGDILSGEVLIDNEEYRNDILEAFPTAIGGEMEGAGLAASAHANMTEWIVVKSICDFADGKKSRSKQKKQKIAAEAAASLCHYVFDNEYSFESFGISSISNEETQSHGLNKIIECTQADNNIIPEIPGFTDMGIQDNRKLTQAFFGQSISKRLSIATQLGLMDLEELHSDKSKEKISAQILLKAHEYGKLAQLWKLLFNETTDPNPFV